MRGGNLRGGIGPGTEENDEEDVLRVPCVMRNFELEPRMQRECTEQSCADKL